jgi:uncharacterized membrane protein
LNLGVVIPGHLGAGSQSALYGRYPLLGSNFGEMIRNLWQEPSRYGKAILYYPQKYGKLLGMLTPAGALVFLAPNFLIPVLISVLPHLLSQATTQLSLSDIYGVPPQPFIFLGSLYGALWLWKRTGERYAVPMAGVALIIAGIGVQMSPRFYRATPAQRRKAFQEVLARIPPDASVAAQQNLYPHVDARRTVQLFPIGVAMSELQTRYLKNPDYVLCDRRGNALPWNGDQLREAIAALESDPDYVKEIEQESFVVFRRISEGPAEWVPPIDPAAF